MPERGTDHDRHHDAHRGYRRRVLERILRERGDVRLIARHPSRLTGELRPRGEVVEGSHAERDVVERTLHRARRVVWPAPGSPDRPSAEAAYVGFSRAFRDALASSTVTHVVGISALGRGWPRPAGHVAASLRMDEMIVATGVSYRALEVEQTTRNALGGSTSSVRGRGPRQFGASMRGGSTGLRTPQMPISTAICVSPRSPTWPPLAAITSRGCSRLQLASRRTPSSRPVVWKGRPRRSAPARSWRGPPLASATPPVIASAPISRTPSRSPRLWRSDRKVGAVRAAPTYSSIGLFLRMCSRFIGSSAVPASPSRIEIDNGEIGPGPARYLACERGTRPGPTNRTTPVAREILRGRPLPGGAGRRDRLYDGIAGHASPEIALGYVERIEAFLGGFAHAAKRGHRRDDLRPRAADRRLRTARHDRVHGQEGSRCALGPTRSFVISSFGPVSRPPVPPSLARAPLRWPHRLARAANVRRSR